jgi:hypothetical protein
VTSATWQEPAPIEDADFDKIVWALTHPGEVPEDPDGTLRAFDRQCWAFEQFSASVVEHADEWTPAEQAEAIDLLAAWDRFFFSVQWVTANLPAATCDCSAIQEVAGPHALCDVHLDTARASAGLAPYYPVPRKNRGQHYGLTHAELQALYNRAGARCEICRSPDVEPSQLFIDHNHATGDVRGLLCPRCNTGLGLLQDNPSIVADALTYLETHGHYGQASS